ncbi:two-partner secretion domain-containing protein, partial [Klebsiella pneumoniae]
EAQLCAIADPGPQAADFAAECAVPYFADHLQMLEQVRPEAVIVANPNGITCDGCGFINTTRGTLTTGTPVFGNDGSLSAFRVARGTIRLEGNGLDAGN